MSGGPRALQRAYAAAAGVPDPEIPVVTIEDLGILRMVRVGDDGTVDVALTPTYSGCPATEVIRADVEQALRNAGFEQVRVQIDLAVWTTDWLTDRGRAALLRYGVAPPSPRPSSSAGTGETDTAGGSGSTVQLGMPVGCPRCTSMHTRQVSRFGSTLCKAQWVCQTCGEPFELFKPH